VTASPGNPLHQAWGEPPLSRVHPEPPNVIGSALNEIDEKMSALLKDLQQIQTNWGIGKFGKYYVANFMFLLILVGIELDMAGLLMSIGTYWDYDNPILRVLVFFFSLSFLFPLGIQTWVNLSDDAASSMDASASGLGAEPGVRARTKGSGVAGFMDSLRSGVKAANPHGGRMELYHWVPGVRFYLIVKQSYSLTDVDAVFKVNTLSSFTLGIYQLLGILATAVMGKPFNVYVTLNIISQILNWGITVAYFITPVSKWMGNAANARSMSRHYQGIMNAFAAQQQVLAGSVGSHSAQFDDAKQTITRMKAHVASLVISQFFPVESEGKSQAHKILDSMRDQDLKEFILLLRNQTMAAIDMPGGV